MEELTFEMQTDLAAIRTFSLDANFDECKAQLTAMMEPYKGLIVTEDSIPGAKKDRSRINAIYNGIEDARKSVKRIYSKPLKDFEARCKELTDICLEASGNIDRQIKVFENEKKSQKKAALEHFYNVNAGETKDYLSFDAIFDPRWLNVTFDFEDATARIEKALLRCETDIKSIKMLDSKYESALLEDYKSNHDLGRAITLNKQWLIKDEEAELQKAMRERELETARLAAQRAREQQAPTTETAGTEQPVTAAQNPSDDDVVVVDFRVKCTRRQLALLKAFLTEAGIKYGRCNNCKS